MRLRCQNNSPTATNVLHPSLRCFFLSTNLKLPIKIMGLMRYLWQLIPLGRQTVGAVHEDSKILIPPTDTRSSLSGCLEDIWGSTDIIDA